MGLRHRFAAWVITNRIFSLAILLVITAFFAVGLTKVQVKTIFSDLFPKNHPFVQTFKAHSNFGNPLTVVFMVKRKDGNIYNADTLEKIWDMTRLIDLAPAVDHDQILSIATEKARYAEATPDGVEVKALMDSRAPRTAEELEDFKVRVDRANNVRTFLISGDETATLVSATFIERTLDYGETFKYVQDMAEKMRDEHHDIYVAGQPVLTGWVYHYQRQMIEIFGITAAALILSLVFYMRNVPGVVAPITVSIIGGIWGFGLTGWLQQPIEPLIMVVPMLLVARAFSHCVQYLERYYEILHEVKDKRKAAHLSLGVMMAPGVLGIITDFVCLYLIAIAPIPVMERFAIFTGTWAVALIPTDVFLSAILASFLPTPKNVDVLIGKSDKKTWHNDLINMLGHIANLSHGAKAMPTTIVVALVSVGAIYLAAQLRIGNPVEGSNLLFEKSEFNTAVRAINSHFPGLMTLEIVFEAKGKDEAKDASFQGEKAPRIMRQAETLASMLKVQRFLEAEPQPPEATLSFGDYLPEASRLISGGNPKMAPLDNTDAAADGAVTALLLGSNAKNYGHVTDFTMQNGTVSLWYKDNKQETVDMALDQAKRAVASVGIEHSNFRIRLATGAIALQQSVNDVVHQNKWLILGCLNVIILFVVSFAYRSFVAGFILLIPVNLSNAMLEAVMVLLGIGLDVNSLPIASIGIGVGIDYGIYLVSRMCEEYQDSQDYGKAIQHAIQTSGKAIFFTATIVLISIMPWYFMSKLKFLSDMGLLLVMVMTINMIVSLVMLPLLVWWIKPKFIAAEGHLISEKMDLTEHRA